MAVPEKSGAISLVGVGGVGSRVAEGLVRLGVGEQDSSLTLYDPDFFETKNIRNQLCTPYHVGAAKVEAVASQLLSINPDLCIDTNRVSVRSGILLNTPIVILCLDSMNARREIIEYCLGPKVECVIETRMDSAVGCSLCFDPRNRVHQECWWVYWHPDGEAENRAGCQGESPVISAIYGTVTLALKQFEAFLAKEKSAVGIKNRVYTDFDNCYTKYETWPA
jgi:ThiF family